MRRDANAANLLPEVADVKPRKEGALDVVNDVLEGFPRIEIIDRRSLLEGYVSGDLMPHLHFYVSDERDIATNYFCAVYQRARGEYLPRVNHETGRKRRYRDRANGCLNDIQTAVLVDIAEVMQPPQGMTSVVIPSMIRLQLLDDCLRVWPDAHDLVKPAPALGLPASIKSEESLLIAEDGELCTLKVTSETYMMDSKRVGQVVQGRPETEQDIANQDAQAGRRSPEDFNAKDPVVTTFPFWLELIHDSAHWVVSSTDVFGDFRLKGPQVLFRSADLKFGAGGMIHGVNSDYERRQAQEAANSRPPKPAPKITACVPMGQA